jgi:hypothetical protein
MSANPCEICTTSEYECTSEQRQAETGCPFKIKPTYDPWDDVAASGGIDLTYPPKGKTMSKLKNCPLCGSSQIEIYSEYEHVMCSACGVIAESESAWNTRTPDPRVKELVEALADLVFECDGIIKPREPSLQAFNAAFKAVSKWREG